MNLVETGSWSFTIVLSSLIFAWIGYKMDCWFHIEPTFMIGLLILSVIMSIYRIFNRAKKLNK